MPPPQPASDIDVSAANEVSATTLARLVWDEPAGNLTTELAWRMVRTACAAVQIPDNQLWSEYAITKGLEVAIACRQVAETGEVTVSAVRDHMASQGKGQGDAARFAAVIAACKAQAQAQHKRAPPAPQTAVPETEAERTEGGGTRRAPGESRLNGLMPYEAHRSLLAAEAQRYMGEIESQQRINRENLEAERAMHRAHLDAERQMHRQQLEQLNAAALAQAQAAAAQAQASYGELVGSLRQQVSASQRMLLVLGVGLCVCLIAAITSVLFWKRPADAVPQAPSAATMPAPAAPVAPAAAIAPASTATQTPPSAAPATPRPAEPKPDGATPAPGPQPEGGSTHEAPATP